MPKQITGALRQRGAPFLLLTAALLEGFVFAYRFAA